MLQVTTIFFLISLSVLATLHFIALQLSLYWYFSWLDIPMHAFGGMVLAFGIFTAYDLRVIKKDWLQALPVWLLSLVCIFGWEVFKLYTGKVIDEAFVLDTIMDITIGSIGSMLGYYVAKSIRTL